MKNVDCRIRTTILLILGEYSVYSSYAFSWRGMPYTCIKKQLVYACKIEGKIFV